MGDRAAEGTGDGESAVEGSAAELLGGLSLDDSNWGSGRGHCECIWGGCGGEKRSMEWRCNGWKFSGPEKTD